VARQDVSCQRCGLKFTPALKGPLPRHCPPCRRVLGQESRRVRRGTPREWTCIDCNETFPRENDRGTVPKRCRPCGAQARRDTSRRWQEANRGHRNESARRWRERNPDKARAASRKSQAKRRREDPESIKREKLRSSYGLTDEELDELFKRADGSCELCETSFGDDSATRPVIDHDHREGRVRGLICGNCNTGLGFAGDSSDVLRNLADWLEQPPGIPT